MKVGHSSSEAGRRKALRVDDGGGLRKVEHSRQQAALLDWTIHNKPGQRVEGDGTVGVSAEVSQS